MIDRDLPRLSVARQCDLLELARSTLYYQPVEDDADDLALDYQTPQTVYLGLAGTERTVLCLQS